jgi:diacylglycerol kinase family enzyme
MIGPMTGSPFGALAVIAAPPRSGGTAIPADAIEATIGRLGLPFRIQLATADGDATRLAAAALDEGYRFLVAAGDDGTIQDVVNGLFREGRPIVDEPVLAVLPTGRSDLVRSFGLPTDLEGAARHLLGDETYPFDVMRIGVTGPDGALRTRYAANLLEVGLHAAAWRAASRLPAFLGNARRFLGFWGAYLRSRSHPLRVQTDRKTHELRAWSVVVGNGQFAEGGIRLSPRSFPGDGILDALVFTGPKSDAYRLLPRMFRHGDHVPDPGITELRARISLRVESPVPLPVVADGEVLGTTPVSVQLLPHPILLKL